MRMLQQHGGTIYVRIDGDTYMETPENFADDYGSPMPSLESSFDERVYEPGKRHALAFENSVIDGGEMPWPEGDAIIEAAPMLLGKQATRRQAEQEAQQQQVQQVVTMDREQAEADLAQLRLALDALSTREEKNALLKQFNDERRAREVARVRG